MEEKSSFILAIKGSYRILQKLPQRFLKSQKMLLFINLQWYGIFLIASHLLQIISLVIEFTPVLPDTLQSRACKEKLLLENTCRDHMLIRCQMNLFSLNLFCMISTPKEVWGHICMKYEKRKKSILWEDRTFFCAKHIREADYSINCLCCLM